MSYALELLENKLIDGEALAPSTLARFRKLIAVSGVEERESPGTKRIQLQFVPGRIEVLGKHTDYAGGESLTCASQRGIVAVAEKHDRSSLILHDYARSINIEIPYDNPTVGPSWSVYPVAVLKRMIRHFGRPQSGIHVSMHSDLPSASGMSSSSSLVITVLQALLFDQQYSDARSILSAPETLSGFAGALESGADFEDFVGDEGVGTRGGSQDHTAIVMSKAGELGLFAYHPVEKLKTVRLPHDFELVIGGSGIKASKTGDAKEKYNLASDRAAEVARLYSEDVGEYFETMGSMMASPNFDRDSLRHCIRDDSLWDRFSQFERECGLVIPRVIAAIDNGDWVTVGSMCDESHRMAADLLGNQIPETSFLVSSAREKGAVGACGFGAGFGGAVWALVRRSESDDFLTKWKSDYAIRYPLAARKAVFFKDSPGPGAFIIR